MTDNNIARALHLGILMGTLELRYSFSHIDPDDQSDIEQMQSMINSLFRSLELSSYVDKASFTSGHGQEIQ